MGLKCQFRADKGSKNVRLKLAPFEKYGARSWHLDA